MQQLWEGAYSGATLRHPPTPVPGSLDTMLLELAANRANMNAAANPDCDWLFLAPVPDSS